MIIIGQNHTSIINFDKLIVIFVEEASNWDVVGGWIIKARTNNETDCIYELGRYKTKKRAEEVLREIINKYQEYMNLHSPKDGIVGVYTVPRVYEMPEE